MVVIGKRKKKGTIFAVDSGCRYSPRTSCPCNVQRKGWGRSRVVETGGTKRPTNDHRWNHSATRINTTGLIFAVSIFLLMRPRAFKASPLISLVPFQCRTNTSRSRIISFFVSLVNLTFAQFDVSIVWPLLFHSSIRKILDCNRIIVIVNDFVFVESSIQIKKNIIYIYRWTLYSW